MLFAQDRDQMRQFFCQVWQKKLSGQTLEPLENMVADVIGQHPEYQSMLQDPEHMLALDYTPEQGKTNPFLHMGMHIAIQEQLSADRPAGIRTIYQRLCRRFADQHEAEHQMLEVLGETLWEAQRGGTMPDGARYLKRLKKLRLK